MVEVTLRELRHGLRRLRRSPGFTVAAVATLALGIGAVTSVFSVVNAVLLRPLPYPAAERLVVMLERRGEDEISVAYPDLLDWRERNRTFQGPAGYVGQSFTLTESGPAERLRGLMVTSDLFDVLGIEPVLGRGFTEAEDQPGAARVIVIGHGLWQRRFGGDAGVIGRTIRLNSEPYEVVGVMPAGFDFPGGLVYRSAELWAPIGLVAAGYTERGSHPGLYAVGRLRDGVAYEAALSDMEGIAAALRAEYPADNERIDVSMRSALDELVGPVRPALIALLSAVGLLLLIVCANVANLLIVRSTARRHETRIRAALGASRGGLLGPALSESLILAVSGGGLGVLLARWLTTVGAVLLTDVPRTQMIRMDGTVLAFAAGVTGLTAVLFGLAPALHALRTRSGTWLRRQGAARETTRLRSGLVVAEIALSAVVLVGAGLLVRSFASLRSTDPGIDAEGAIAFQVRLPDAEYAEGEPVRAFYGELLDRLEALPGATAAGGISTLPFSGAGSQSTFVPSDRSGVEPLRSDVAVVTPDYFDSFGIAVLSGRAFTDADAANGPPVVVVDERFARRFWPGGDAVGQRISGWGLQDAEIVGVVGHVRNYGTAADSREEVYMPHAQRSYYAMWVTVRVQGGTGGLVPAIRQVVADIDPAIPVESVIAMPELIAARISTPRLTATLGGGFALLALLLAAIGIYGVMAFSVSHRTREIGTRIALGADPGSVIGGVLRHGAALTVAGLALGLPAAWMATRVIESQIHGISASDPTTWLLLPVVLLAIALAATLVPARRAARIAPIEALRQE